MEWNGNCQKWNCMMNLWGLKKAIDVHIVFYNSIFNNKELGLCLSLEEKGNSNQGEPFRAQAYWKLKVASHSAYSSEFPLKKAVLRSAS